MRITSSLPRDVQLPEPGQRPVRSLWFVFKQALELVLIWGQETLPG